MSSNDLTGYFDYAAATPIDSAVLKAMLPYYSEAFFNPSAQYEPARIVKKAYENARARAAKVLGAKPVEITFTAGATEANNLAIRGVMEQFPEANIVYSAVEHDSVRIPAQKYEHTECPVDQSGMLNVENLSQLIDENTVLISVMYANNEIGTIQPLRKVAALIEKIRADRKTAKNNLPLYLHTDAAQAVNYLDLQVHRLGVDLLTINGGKIYGPKQSGLLFVKGGIVLKPQIIGGGQERNLRSGTENIAGAEGLVKALELADEKRLEEALRLKQLQGYFIKSLQSKLPQVVINGSLKNRLPNNVHITIEGQDNERLMMLLDEKGYWCAVGSACSASSEEPSHVLSAIGLSEDQARSSLRFTMGRYTTEESIAGMVDALVAIQS